MSFGGFSRRTALFAMCVLCLRNMLCCGSRTFGSITHAFQPCFRSGQDLDAECRGAVAAAAAAAAAGNCGAAVSILLSPAPLINQSLMELKTCSALSSIIASFKRTRL